VLGQLGGVATPDVADGWLTVSDDLSPEAQRYRLVTDGDETLTLSDKIALAQAANQGRSVRELRIIAHALRALAQSDG
jgi:hypothetical protein